MFQRTRLVAAVIALLGPLGMAPGAGPQGIVIDTDRSVNCTNLKSIVEDVCRGCKTQQEKAIALYNFMVRTVWMDWHSHRPLEMTNISYKGKRQDLLVFANDPVKYIVVYGNCGCGPQAGVYGALCEAAGLKFHHLNPGFGHVSGEVFCEGKWRWLDVWLPAYVTDAKGDIYSYDEIMADRTRFSKARDEGRCPENFMVNYSADLGAVVNAKGYKAGDAGGYAQKYVENLTLRPGESCTWLWGNVGKWYSPSGPYLDGYLDRQFPCGPACKFGNDQVLKKAFPYWQPYQKTIPDGPHSQWNKTYYRYYGNAVFVHEPALTARGLANFGAKLTNVKPAGQSGLVLAQPPAGHVEMSFALPYVIADTEIEGQAEMGPVGAALSFCFSTDGGKSWLLGGEVKKAGQFGPISIGKPNTYEFPAGSTSGQYGFALKIVFRCDSQRHPPALKSLKITNTTMLNFYSRPWLELGKNNVTVTCKNEDALADTALEMTWKWLEDWHTQNPSEKSFHHKVAKSGAACAIEAGGSKLPKMKSITIACPKR